MGWAVLYIAFGVVALWLLGEVLLQYKARLRWRLLAFVGFLGVVLGVLIPSVIVIGLGAVAFAVGQTYVTLSFRRGFRAGWAVNTPLQGRGKDDSDDAEHQEPPLEGYEPETAGDGGHGDADDGRDDGTGHGPGRNLDDDRAGYGQDDDHERDDVFTPAASTPAGTSAVYEPQPMPDDTGSYGVYSDQGYAAPSQDQYAATAQGADQNYGYDYSGYGQQQGYDTTGRQYGVHDPGTGAPGAYSGMPYESGYTDQQQYGQQGYTQDPYAGGYGGETAGDGVWVPQQRSTDDTYGGELPQQQYPYPGDGQTQGNGYDEQYRY